MHPSTPEKPSTTRPMRRADREVRSFEEIIDILRNCTEVRVAYQDAQGLTIVPVNFAFVYNNDDSSHNLRLLMHSATQGRLVYLYRSHTMRHLDGIPFDHRHRSSEPAQRRAREDRRAETADEATHGHAQRRAAAASGEQGRGLADYLDRVHRQGAPVAI